MTRDNQKLALLTGAAGVLGSETARGLAADGYRVVMVDIEAEKLEALAREIGKGAYPLPLDVSDPQKVAEACATVRQELGQVSVLVVEEEEAHVEARELEVLQDLVGQVVLGGEDDGEGEGQAEGKAEEASSSKNVQ